MAFTISNQKNHNLLNTINPHSDKTLVEGNQQTLDKQSANATIEQGTFDPSRFLSEDFLAILNEHRKNCEREGKLDQATQARKRLKELRIFEEEKRK